LLFREQHGQVRHHHEDGQREAAGRARRRRADERLIIIDQSKGLPEWWDIEVIAAPEQRHSRLVIFPTIFSNPP